jgi:hypothetical protein
MRISPFPASPGAAAHVWGSRAHVLQRVPEYHIAPRGLTAKRSSKSSIFLPTAVVPVIPIGALRSHSVYIDVFRGDLASGLAVRLLPCWHTRAHWTIENVPASSEGGGCFASRGRWPRFAAAPWLEGRRSRNLGNRLPAETAPGVLSLSYASFQARVPFCFANV